MVRFFRKYHKWAGLFISFFIVMSALSGIVLNHRKFFSDIGLSRKLMPPSYRYSNWNNAAVKGSFRLSPDSVLLYGGAGIWLTDTLHSYFEDFGKGLKRGADNRQTTRIVRTSDGSVYAATTFDLYRLNADKAWENVTAMTGLDERIADLAVKGDTLVVVTRSNLYISAFPFEHFIATRVNKPADYSPSAPLFRTLWLLHSGGLFGLAGRLFVDLLGVVMIILCVTGVIFAFSPGIIKRRKTKGLSAKTTAKAMRSSLRWHNKAGAVFVFFLVVLALSGMFLRPPLMIVIIRSTVKPVPGSSLSSDNPWHDKLRSLRYDTSLDEWLLYTSSGFYGMKSLNSVPVRLTATPPVSVMGVTVLEPVSSIWFVGSFSGLYIWNRENGMIIDCYSGLPSTGRPMPGRPSFNNQISGYSGDFHGKIVIFEFDKGARTFGMSNFAPMPAHVSAGKISLWHAALEVHVGRAYRPLIGPFSDLFVTLLGLFTVCVLVSGYIVYRKRHRKARSR